MRKMLVLAVFVAALVALLPAVVPAQPEPPAPPAPVSLTLRVVGEGGLGIPSGTFPNLNVELYRYEDVSSVEPRWVSSSNCWEGAEPRRLCANADGVLVINEDWNGAPLKAGAYLVGLFASNYEGQWYQFEAFDGENLKDNIALTPRPISVFPRDVRISAEGDMEVGLVLVANSFRPVRAEVYVVAEGPGLTERWMTRQLGNGYRPRVYTITRRRAGSHFEYLRINPEVPDGLTYCLTVYVMRPGSMAFGEAIGRATFCRPKGAENGGGKGG